MVEILNIVYLSQTKLLNLGTNKEYDIADINWGRARCGIFKDPFSDNVYICGGSGRGLQTGNLECYDVVKQAWISSEKDTTYLHTDYPALWKNSDDRVIYIASKGGVEYMDVRIGDWMVQNEIIGTYLFGASNGTSRCNVDEAKSWMNIVSVYQPASLRIR